MESPKLIKSVSEIFTKGEHKYYYINTEDEWQQDSDGCDILVQGNSYFDSNLENHKKFSEALNAGKKIKAVLSPKRMVHGK